MGFSQKAWVFTITRKIKIGDFFNYFFHSICISLVRKSPTVPKMGTKTVMKMGTKTVTKMGTKTVTKMGTKIVPKMGTKTVLRMGSMTVPKTDST